MHRKRTTDRTNHSGSVVSTGKCAEMIKSCFSICISTKAFLDHFDFDLLNFKKFDIFTYYAISVQHNSWKNYDKYCSFFKSTAKGLSNPQKRWNNVEVTVKCQPSAYKQTHCGGAETRMQTKCWKDNDRDRRADREHFASQKGSSWMNLGSRWRLPKSSTDYFPSPMRHSLTLVTPSAINDPSLR